MLSLPSIFFKTYPILYLQTLMSMSGLLELVAKVSHQKNSYSTHYNTVTVKMKSRTHGN